MLSYFRYDICTSVFLIHVYGNDNLSLYVFKSTLNAINELSMIFLKKILIYKTKRKTNLQIVLRLEIIDIILIKQKVVQTTW